MSKIESDYSVAMKQCEHLWGEYKYRHDLVWQRIFTFTTAIVLISMVPYIQLDIIRIIGFMILIAPFLGFLLAGFGFLIINNELRLLNKVKSQYRRHQNKILDKDLRHDLDKKGTFNIYVQFYFGSLIYLSFLNLEILGIYVVPKLLSMPFFPCA